MGFLSKVMAETRARLDAKPLDDGPLRERLALRAPAADLVAALRADPPAVIAEVKRASPSAGTIAGGVDPAARAREYAAGGAAAVSVLTNRHFGGSLADLATVRDAVDLPLLRKDFIVHPSQVVEARASGADAVLAITACLDDDELSGLLDAAHELAMDVLIETHSDDDLARALATDARIIGINARDLETLEVDLGAAIGRLRVVPGDRVAVLESGVTTRADVEAALAAGASAILVGETLMRAADPAAAIRDLRGTR